MAWAALLLLRGYLITSVPLFTVKIVSFVSH